MVTHELKEVTITCLPKDLPESIEVDLGELKAGDVVYLSDIKLPKGVEIPALALGGPRRRHRHRQGRQGRRG